MTRKDQTKVRAVARTRRGPLLALLAGLAFTAAALSLAPHAQGQVFNSTPYVAAPDPAIEQLRSRIDAMEGDLKRAVDKAETLAAQLSDSRRAADDANNRAKKLEGDLAALQARVDALEAIAHGNADAIPATGSIQAAEATVNLTGQAAPPHVDIASLPQDEAGLLKEARNLLLDSNFASAEEAFKSFLTKYPKSANAHEAQYFLGESLLYQDDYTGAAKAYGKLLNDYPKSENGPNALVKLARSMRLMQKTTEACKTLDLMPKQFPKASSAAKQLASRERQLANCK
jgi:tol-pal system protein YbgF